MIKKRDKTNHAVFFNSSIHHFKETKKKESTGPGLLLKENEAIRQYYVSLSPHEGGVRFSYDCFAVRLARIIIANLADNNQNLVQDGLLSEVFYSECIERATRAGLMAVVKDPELMLIYIKQMVLLLRNSGVISVKKSSAVVKKHYEEDFQLLIALFDSFWNRCSWQKLFPSDPEAASRLKPQRSILKDIVLAAEYRTDVGKLSNDFFNLTGFAPENDLFMISFIDFYVFTWLRHFGVVRYFISGRESAVSLEITPNGKTVFSAVS